MARVNIVINQEGKSAGTAGVSRDDLSLSALVTLTNNDNTGVISWKWEFIGWPRVNPSDAAPTLSGATTSIATFTPLIRGTYIIQLTVNGSIKGRIGGAIKTQVSTVRVPCALEGSEFTGGWEWATSNVLATMDSFIAGGGPPSGPASGDLEDSYPGPTVGYIRNQKIADLSSVVNGQVLTWNNGAAQWEPATPSSGSTTFIALTDTPSSYSGQANKIVAVNSGASGLEFVSTAPAGGSAGGNLSGTYPNPTVVKIQGNSISDSAPSDGQVLTWSASGGNWAPSSVVSTFIGLTDTPTSYDGYDGYVVSVNIGLTALTFSESPPPGGAASGDLGDNYPNPTVVGLQGNSISTLAPTTGQSLIWNDISSKWTPTSQGFVDLSDTPSSFSTYGGYLVRVNSGATALEFFNTATGDLSGTYPNPLVAGLQGRAVSSDAPGDGYALVWDLEHNKWSPLSLEFISLFDTPSSYIGYDGYVVAVNIGATGLEFVESPPPGGAASGDLSDSYPNPIVVGLQGNLISDAAPSDGQILAWSVVDGYWKISDAAASAFTDLTDCPSTYTGNEGGLVKINVAGSELEFIKGTSLKDIIMWDGEPAEFSIVSGTLSSFDVDYAGLTDGDVLTWNTSDGYWCPRPASGGGTLDRILLFSDDTEFTETGSTFSTKKTFRVVSDSDKAVSSWRLVFTAWIDEGGTAEVKLSITDSAEPSNTDTVTKTGISVDDETVYNIEVEKGIDNDSVATVIIQLRAVTSGTAYLRYTDLYAIYV